MEEAFSRLQRTVIQQDDLCYKLLQEGRSLKEQLEKVQSNIAENLGSPYPSTGEQPRCSPRPYTGSPGLIHSTSGLGKVDENTTTLGSVPANAPIQPNAAPSKTKFAKFVWLFNKSASSLKQESEMGSTQPSKFSHASQSNTGWKAPNMVEGALDLRKKRKALPLENLKNYVTHATTSSIDLFVVDHPVRGRFRRLAENSIFSLVCSSFIILSAVLIGVEIECEAREALRVHLNQESWWEVCSYETSFLVTQVIIGLVFIAEVGIRVVAYDVSFFGYGVGRIAKEWQWNVFDVICLIGTLIDICCAVFTWQVTYSNFLRQFRIIRVTTTIRTARFAREFRKMSYALQYSGSTLMWAIVTLLFVIYFFAAAFTQAATEELKKSESREGYLGVLEDAYGTLPISMHSLFQAVAGGIDWVHIIDPLIQIGWVSPTLFLFFIAATTFGVMNVVTSVFVESAVASYHYYKELLIQENIATRKLYITHLQEIFVQIDHDKSGEISIEELERFLTDPHLQQYLESIDVHPSDATTLFKLLDKDGSGLISLEEFCNGCLRLKGEAKSYDIHCMIYENERIMHKFQDLISYLEKGLLARVDQTVDKTLRQSLHGARLSTSYMDDSSSLSSPAMSRQASFASRQGFEDDLKKKSQKSSQSGGHSRGLSGSRELLSPVSEHIARGNDGEKPLTPRESFPSPALANDISKKAHPTPLPPIVGRDFPFAFAGLEEQGII